MNGEAVSAAPRLPHREVVRCNFRAFLSFPYKLSNILQKLLAIQMLNPIFTSLPQ